MNIYGVLYYNQANQTYGRVHGDWQEHAVILTQNRHIFYSVRLFLHKKLSFRELNYRKYLYRNSSRSATVYKYVSGVQIFTRRICKLHYIILTSYNPWHDSDITDARFAFPVAASRMWNTLPPEVTSSGIFCQCSNLNLKLVCFLCIFLRYHHHHHHHHHDN